MAKHAPEIIAFHLGTDVESVKEGRYQRTVNPAVYVYGEDYYCAPTQNQKLPKDMTWELSGEEYGRKIYVYKI